MKISKKNSITNKRRIPDEVITNFANTLKEEKKKDKFKFESLLKSDEFNSILKEILTHSYKKETEIYILNTYLRSLSKFMNIIQFSDKDTVIENFLSKVSSNLQSLFLEKNNMLMKIGDQGDYFYIILSGSVSVLVTKIISVYMSPEQFTQHLKLLYNNEPYLFENTIKLNRKSANFVELNNVKVKDINYVLDGKNKVKSLDEYISIISGEKFIDESSQFYNEVKLMVYFKVTELTQGNSFGEIALIDSKQKRTASIYTSEDCFFGKLSSNAYKKSMKKIQEQIKRDNIDFVFNTQLFNQISLSFFTQSYWNYFINRTISKGDYLFKEGFERDEIYFIHEGEIKISCNLNFKKIESILGNLLPYYKEKYDKNLMNKNNETTLCFGNKGEILGMGDLLYKNKYFCNAICESKNASFFAIDINIFLSIAKNFTDIFIAFKKLEDKKKKIIIRRLKTIKYTFQNSFIGEQTIENGIITKSGKEINFDDWFDSEKNFPLKSNKCKRKTTLINIEEIKKKNFLSLSKDKNRLILHKKTAMPLLKKTFKFSPLKNYKKKKIRNTSSLFSESNIDTNNNSTIKNRTAINMYINKDNLNPSLIEFHSKKPKLNINEYGYHNHNYYGRNKNYSNDQIIRTIIFTDREIISKMLKKERKDYINLMKKNDENISLYEKATLFTTQFKSRISSVSINPRLYSARKYITEYINQS